MANVWPNSSGFTTEDTEHIEELIVASQMGGVSWRVKLGWSGEFVLLVHTRPLRAAGAPLVLDNEAIIRHPMSILLNCVALVGCLKLVESDVVFIDAHAFQHGAGGLDHRLRAAEIVFQGGGVFVLAEVFTVEHFVDEAGV